MALAVAVAAASDAADAPPAEPATALPDNDAVAASNEEPAVEEPAASASERDIPAWVRLGRWARQRVSNRRPPL